MQLSRFEQHQATVVGRSILPTGALGGLTDQRDVGAEVARQFALQPWWSAIGVRAALWVIWFAPIWRQGRLKLFSSLNAEDQSKCVELLSRSNFFWLREMILLVKLAVCMALIGDRKVLAYLSAYDSAGGPVALRRSGS
jgi:hypothetical protein